MHQLLLTITRRLRPDRDTLTEREQSLSIANVFGILYSTPLLIGGLVWLILSTAPGERLIQVPLADVRARLLHVCPLD